MDDVEVWLACKDEGKFKSEGEELKNAVKNYCSAMSYMS
jgi:hypothetical protein